MPKAYFGFFLQLEKIGAKVLHKMNIKEGLQITVCNYYISGRNAYIPSSFFFSPSLCSKSSSKAEIVNSICKMMGAGGC